MIRKYTKYLPALVLCGFMAGCSTPYMQNRANDAKDVFDGGLTFSAKPQFSLYADFFNITPIGYSHMETNKVTKVGITHRNIGIMPYQNNNWGALLWGKKIRGAEPFNPLDPHEARSDQRDLTERPAYNTGLVRMISEGDVPPPLQFMECERSLHLGWIGINLGLRPVDLVDFILGWTTLDILHDDTVKAPR